MACYVPVAKVEAKEICIRTSIERRAVAARAMRVLTFLFGGPALPSPPLLDSADRNARDLSHLTVV
jgi:hypothetical protein